MKILVFGGNGFIGAETVKILLDSGDADVTVVNRGVSWDWDTPSTIKPRVRYIHADRDEPLSEFPELCEYVKEVFHDVTIDFSGYSPVAVKETIRLLTGRTDLYIFISSDSVYEVCQEKQHCGPSKETDANRPVEEADKKKARRRDSYGDDKLSAEEVLMEHCKSTNNGPSYVILRLADVIGPRDSTNRFWQYQIWIEMAFKCKALSVSIPKKYECCPLSFVFSTDVAKLISKLVHMTAASREGILNQSYNLACSQTLTLPEFLQKIKISLGLQNYKLNISTEDGDQVPQIYPSVERGPIDITKAKSTLNWLPTPIDSATLETVKFYKEVVKKKLFVRERKDVYRDLKESLEDIFDEQTVKKHIKEALLLK